MPTSFGSSSSSSSSVPASSEAALSFLNDDYSSSSLSSSSSSSSSSSYSDPYLDYNPTQVGKVEQTANVNPSSLSSQANFFGRTKHSFYVNFEEHKDNKKENEYLHTIKIYDNLKFYTPLDREKGIWRRSEDYDSKDGRWFITSDDIKVVTRYLYSPQNPARILKYTSPEELRTKIRKEMAGISAIHDHIFKFIHPKLHWIIQKNPVSESNKPRSTTKVPFVLVLPEQFIQMYSRNESVPNISTNVLVSNTGKRCLFQGYR